MIFVVTPTGTLNGSSTDQEANDSSTGPRRPADDNDDDNDLTLHKDNTK